MATPAELVIARFGSAAEVARTLDLRPSAITHWTKTGRVPTKHHGPLLAAAAEARIRLEPADLIVQAPPRKSAPPEALYSGDLMIGDRTIQCYVLQDGRRVISRSGALRSLAGGEGAKTGGDLEAYLRPLGYEFTSRLPDELIDFTIAGTSTADKKTLGITADFFLDICKAFVVARDTGRLTTERQIGIAVGANAFILACAGVGLTALIDEATGYQYQREEKALEAKLNLFLEREMRKWEKTFPDELWIEFGRLTNWQGSVHQRPKYWGTLVNRLIYEALDPDVAEWLKENQPKPRHGQNYHQWLSEQYGLRKLTEHIWMIIGMARACSTLRELDYKVAEQFGKEVLELRLFADVT